MSKYFTECKTAEDLRRVYHKLAMAHHPDRPGGDLKTMQAINNEYDIVWPQLKNRHINKDNEAYERATTETARQYPDIIDKIIRFYGIKIEVCGTKIWIITEADRSATTVLLPEEY